MAADPLAEFPVKIALDVRWGDQDAFGHVNNTVFFQYFESARIAYFEKIGFTGANGIGPILHSTQCRFKRPLKYPDSLVVGARVTQVSEDRFTHEYRILSAAQNEVAAEGSGLIVAFDYRSGGKAQLPEEIRKRIAEVEAR